MEGETEKEPKTEAEKQRQNLTPNCGDQGILSQK